MQLKKATFIAPTKGGVVAVRGTAEDQALIALRKAMLEAEPGASCAVLEEGWTLSNLSYEGGEGRATGEAICVGINYGSDKMNPRRKISFMVRWRDGEDRNSMPTPSLVEYEIK
jgi:hypothetical protein